jgi:hypothetical protein
MKTETVVEAHLFAQLEKANQVITKVIDVMNEHIIPDSTLSADNAISQIIGIVDNPEVFDLRREWDKLKD